MTVRAVEWKKLRSWGQAIDVDRQNKIISLRLRDENNLIIYDNGDDEIYVDLQLSWDIEPTDTLPVGITTGRVSVANWWSVTGTLIYAKTTSWDNIKILYWDDNKLYVDNGTGTFKQIYLKPEVDQLLNALRTELQEYADSRPTFKPFPDTFVTDGTTAQFLASVEALNLPVGYAYLGQISCSDLPGGVNVQAEVEVYVYPQNVIHCVLRSAEVRPYIRTCNSYQYRGWEPMCNKYVGSTAPLNPFVGAMWFDETIPYLAIYDGTQWVEIQLNYNPPL